MELYGRDEGATVNGWVAYNLKGHWIILEGTVVDPISHLTHSNQPPRDEVLKNTEVREKYDNTIQISGELVNRKKVTSKPRTQRTLFRVILLERETFPV